MMASEADLDKYLQVATELARRAGKIAKEASYSIASCKIETKHSTADLVTEADKQVEDLILSELKKAFPTHKFIGEECTAAGEHCELTDQPTWMVDPIDGTSNFVHGVPFSAVSIGMAIDKTPVVGVIYNFFTDQMFAARRGGGATVDGTPIHVSKCTELTEALLLSEFGSNRPAEIFKPKVETLYNLAVEPRPVHGFRMLGSAALSMCMVASGKADGYFEYGIHCWDIAAGDVILREAGGVTAFPTGEPLDVMRRGVLCAGTQELVQKLVPHMPKVESQYERD